MSTFSWWGTKVLCEVQEVGPKMTSERERNLKQVLLKTKAEQIILKIYKSRKKPNQITRDEHVRKIKVGKHRVWYTG